MKGYDKNASLFLSIKALSMKTSQYHLHNIANISIIIEKGKSKSLINTKNNN